MEIKKAKLTRKPNYSLLPVTQLKMNTDNMNLFNSELEKCKKYNTIIRTPSGYISKKTRMPAYDVRNTTSCVELTILDITGMYRIQFRNSGEKEIRALSGHACFIKFKEI